MIKIYVSDKAKQQTIDSLKKQHPGVEIITRKNYFVNDDDFIVDDYGIGFGPLFKRLSESSKRAMRLIDDKQN